jgi:hypothetical protein
MDFVFLRPYLQTRNVLMYIEITGDSDVMTCLQDNLGVLEVKGV